MAEGLSRYVEHVMTILDVSTVGALTLEGAIASKSGAEFIVYPDVERERAIPISRRAALELMRAGARIG